ncbi:hypothetical protein D1007_10365 [Hordeum vulgare]|nr:hypothetical protein D1007_10365 [Hordeum vulgare]
MLMVHLHVQTFVLIFQFAEIQYTRSVEARSSLQHDISEYTNLSRLLEKVGDHDVNQLQIPQSSSSPQGLAIDSVSEVRFKRRTIELLLNSWIKQQIKFEDFSYQ